MLKFFKKKKPEKKRILFLALLAVLAVGFLLWKKDFLRGGMASGHFPQEYSMEYSIVNPVDEVSDTEVKTSAVEGSSQKVFIASQKRRQEFTPLQPSGPSVMIRRRDQDLEYFLFPGAKAYMERKVSAPEDALDMLPEAKWKLAGEEKIGAENCKKYQYAAVRTNRAGYMLTCWVSRSTGKPVQIGYHTLEGKDENEKYPARDSIIKIASFVEGAQDPNLFEIPGDFKKAEIPQKVAAKASMQSATTGIQPGDKVPDFVLKGSDGKKYKLSSFKNRAVVLEWINYDCPFVRKFYESGEMPNIQKEYIPKGNIAWFSICSSAQRKYGYYDADKINELNKQYGNLAQAYLMDTKGEVAKRYGVTTTPHVFVINRGTLVYSGAIDEFSSGNPELIGKGKNFLRLALQALIEQRLPNVLSMTPYGTPIPF